MNRKPVSKKIRFEIFKRDGFKCAYCGKTPPAVTLECDHIEPVSAGGTNDLNNLITACFDWNRGKMNIPLETIPQPMQDNMEVIEEKRKQLREYKKFVNKLNKQVGIIIDSIESIYKIAYPDYSLQEINRENIRYFLDQIGIEEVEKSMRIAINAVYEDPAGTWRYFCGICWRRIKGIRSPYEERFERKL